MWAIREGRLHVTINPKFLVGNLSCSTEPLLTTQVISPGHKRLSFMAQMAFHLPRQLGWFHPWTCSTGGLWKALRAVGFGLCCWVSALLPVASLLKTQCKCVYYPGAFKAKSQMCVLLKAILLCVLLILKWCFKNIEWTLKKGFLEEYYSSVLWSATFLLPSHAV